MASNETNNADHTASNFTARIKVESIETSSSLLNEIKTEPGLAATTTRLTSFRMPRDLTLSGNIKVERPKKVYAPNINVRRNKKTEEGITVKNDSKSSKDRGRGRGKADRGRGRGKAANNLIQSTGVFSEGISASSHISKRISSGARDSYNERDAKQILEKPKLNLNRNFDEAEEQKKLKLLLRDDFIDDGTDPDLGNSPIMLPMIEDVKLFEEESRAELEIINDLELDKKPTIDFENGEVKFSEKAELKIPVPKKKSVTKKLPLTIPQVVENKSSNYILIQFPDCLPGLQSDSESDDPRARKAAEPTASGENENKPKPEYCTLGSLKEGMLGKLQILRSGKTRLVLGDNNLVVDLGSNLSFRQDLIATKLDTKQLTGDLVNLGPVSSTFICSPDWESMLSSL